MRYTTLDMDAYPRKAHFAYFRDMANPYVGVTCQADVTKLSAVARQNGWGLFLSTLFVVTKAANAVAPLRQRIRDGGIIEYEWCRPSYTVALPDETYCYCRIDTRTASIAQFIEDGRRAQARAMQEKSLADGEDEGDLLFISCLKWLAYTALTQPTPAPADSNPRITWGRVYTQGDRSLMPLTLLAHHALVDGVHIAKFFEAFGAVQNAL